MRISASLGIDEELKKKLIKISQGKSIGKSGDKKHAKIMQRFIKNLNQQPMYNG